MFDLNYVSVTSIDNAHPANHLTRECVSRKILKTMAPHVPDTVKSVWSIKIVTNDSIKTFIWYRYHTV